MALYNAYGPSEATITATLARVDPADCERAVPIGRPLAGRHAYVVDAHGHLLAPVALGELWLGGLGIAEGYVGRPDLEVGRFVDSPYQRGERLYRTGDRVRLRRDGQIEFVGRVDDQVKIRGFRIELSEVEGALLQAEGVEQVLALCVQHGDALRLVAAVSGASLVAADRPRILADLQKRLPSYMWPQVLGVLPALPQRSSGKVDRELVAQALADLPLQAGDAPSTPMECELAALWTQALGTVVDNVDADYFGLGGDSIVAIRIVAAARARGLAMTPKLFFDRPTLRQMAAHVRRDAPAIGETAAQLTPKARQHLALGDRRPGRLLSREVLRVAAAPDADQWRAHRGGRARRPPEPAPARQRHRQHGGG